METLQAIFPARDCTLLVAIILLPAIGAFVNGVFGKRLGKEAVTLMGLTAIGASFLGSVAAFLMLAAEQKGEEAARLSWTGWDWLNLSPSGELNALGQGGGLVPIKITVGFMVDALSGTMALIVTGVGFLIHLYSTKYMEDDPSYHRFFSYLNLFIFSMLVLILGDSLPVLFVGWEGVGLCSYLLIGFWYGEKANAQAGKKAFITNRIGDFGLLVAMALLIRYTGSLDWTGLSAHGADLLRPITVWQIPKLEGSTGMLGWLAGPGQVTVATLVGLSLFLGCAGKSAQIPLYVWLPDAMAGPTPVSALIHAATMVTAGVYLICRMAPIFVMSPAAMLVVAFAGAATALLAATIALVQNDIKKVLAYSTVSQLGYMFMGVGVGAFTAGFFHVITHAFFKACLFLGAGSVIHAMHARIHDIDGSQDIRNMGGLNKQLKTTHWTFLVSCLAIAGFPGFSGFFSKDEILHHAFANSVRPPTDDGMAYGLKLFVWPSWAGPLLLTAGLLGAVMTAFYMFRLYFLTFWGEFRGWKVVPGWKEPEGVHGRDGHGHDAHGHGHDEKNPAKGDVQRELLEGPQPHEAPWPMLAPLVILGLLATFGGVLLAGMPGSSNHPLEKWLEPVFAASTKSVEVAEKGGIVQPLAILAGLAGIAGAWWVYYSQGGAPAKRLAAQVPGLHQLLYEKWRVDELYDELVIGTVDFIADVCVMIDRYVVDFVVASVTSWLVAVSGYLLRLLHTGRVQAYAAFMVLGTGALGWFFTMPQANAHVERDDASGHYTVQAAPGLGYGYRWDADADGKPDVPEFGEKKSVELSLGVGESRKVRLEVKNAFGRVGSETITLTRPKPEEPKRAELEPNGARSAMLGREAAR
jgi:NADH-quinone oxidoreductase subunit L